MIRKQRQHIAIGLIVVIASLAPISCAGLKHPATNQLSFEGQTAVAGRQFVAAVRTGSDGISQLITAGVLTQADGVKSLQVAANILTQGQNLATVLKTVDEAKTIAEREAGVQQAAQFIKAIQAGVSGLVVPISTEAGRQRVALIAGIIGSALTDLTLQLNKAKAPVTAHLIAGRTWALAA